MVGGTFTFKYPGGRAGEQKKKKKKIKKNGINHLSFLVLILHDTEIIVTTATTAMHSLHLVASK